MKKILILLAILLLSGYVFSQDIKVEKVIPTGINTVTESIGNDILVSQFQPIGPISGIQQSDGALLIAANDTLATSNLGLIIWKSTNNGINWTQFPAGVSWRIKFDQLKLIKTGLDSIYAFFRVGSQVYYWNIYTYTSRTFDSTNIRQFDVVGSSTGSLYLITHHSPANQLRRFGSIDGGATWINPGYIAATSGFPRVDISFTGDTLFICYRNPFTADTVSSTIRIGRYRESAPGTLSSAGFQDVVTGAVPKLEYKTAAANGVAWIFYTTGLSGDLDIYARVSTNNGTNWNAAFPVANNPNVDEYWLDAKPYNVANKGVDFTYYHDSLQSGSPTNSTDMIKYAYASTLTPESFYGYYQVSGYPPEWSDAGYVPQIIEIYTTDKIGVVWVGNDGANKKIFFDADVLSNITPKNGLPEKYSLSQNYPNPFNPATKINFEIAKNGFVTLKVYDILGREVRILVSQNLNAGIYTVDFDASRLSSGTYLYRLESNGFVDIKKMMLIK